ncbi:MAG TPA: N-acetylmuramoyl-L-alanine amidase [Nitrospirales bacterium]|nr:N-acetylmuramoyl-L-alanine amidase [Nitrospirales bacterium]
MIVRAFSIWLALALLMAAVAPMADASGPASGHVLRATQHGKTKRPVSRIATTSMIRDIRLTSSSQRVRLVFDLERAVTFTQMQHKNPDRIVIELQDSALGRMARTRLAEQTFPDFIVINQSNPDVKIALDLDAIGDYKLMPLSRPARLVLDVYPRPEREMPKRARLPAPPAEPVIKALPPAQRASGREINTIVIDAGHGGKDPGAVGRTGLAEKDITLQVALSVRDMIMRHLGKRVLMTRDHDVFVELEDRAQFANKHGADLFVSIHVNSHPQRTTKGIEVYHFGEASDPRAMAVAARENGTPMDGAGVGVQYLLADLLTDKKIESSLELAWTTKKAMLSYLDTTYDVVDHGVKTAPFYVLRYTAMPSILAEIAFITNPTEERLMQSDMFLHRIAEALYQGIKAYVTPLQTASR